MKATVDGIIYEGTEEEIRRIVENPPRRPPVPVTHAEPRPRPGPYPWDKDRWDVMPEVTSTSGAGPQGEAR